MLQFAWSLVLQHPNATVGGALLVLTGVMLLLRRRQRRLSQSVTRMLVYECGRLYARGERPLDSRRAPQPLFALRPEQDHRDP